MEEEKFPTSAVLRYLSTAPTSEFNDQEVTALDAWSGADNLLWHVQAESPKGVQDAVLKLYLDAGQARSRRQFSGHQIFWQFGIAPRPIWTDRYPIGLSRQVLIYEWVPGDPIDPSAHGSMLSFAKAVAQVHDFDPNGIGRFSPNPINLDYYWRVQKGGFPKIEKWLNSIRATSMATIFHQFVEMADRRVNEALPLWNGVLPTPVHGDLQLENVLTSSSTTLLIDWELFGLGDPALEIANFFYLSRLELNRDTQNEWLDAYLSNFNPSGLAERIRYYQQILPFQSVCYLLDGLSSLSAETREAPGVLEFLHATLAATFDHAAISLGIEILDMESYIAELTF